MGLFSSSVFKLAVTAAVSCILGVGIGVVITNLNAEHAGQFPYFTTREGNNGLLINPLLSCDISEDTPAPALNEIRRHLESAANEAVKNGAAKRVSVYVRNMNSGAWTGVNVDDTFSPASLMKLPVLIAYLKQAETNPSTLDRPLTLSKTDANSQEFFKPPAPLPPGGTYSVRELLLAMIQNSDNNAANALKDGIGIDVLLNVYSAFGEPVITEADDTKNILSPKVYMRFFRILYNASYLDKDISQQVLSVLAGTHFPDGLAAGVPESVPVAHKFGERTIQEGDPETGQTKITSLQLHDCGIVYDAHGPYGICVMTEGGDFKTLASVLAAVSKQTYADAEKGLFGVGTDSNTSGK